MTYRDYELRETEDREDDCIKIFHDVYDKEGNLVASLDHSPYEEIDADTFEFYIEFYLTQGRFPSRLEINSCGPLHNEDLLLILLMG